MPYTTFDYSSEMPKDSAIFQLPESPSLYNMENYAPLRGYLHSHTLKWSAGAMKGRSIAYWQEETSQKPLPELLRSIILAGFTGLYIDCDGYEDHAEALRIQLESLLHRKPLSNISNSLLFFDLRSYAKALFSEMPKEELLQKK